MAALGDRIDSLREWLPHLGSWPVVGLCVAAAMYACVPETDQFRLGVQKCRKTIASTLSRDFEFHLSGVQALFKKLRRAVELISSLTPADQLASNIEREQSKKNAK